MTLPALNMIGWSVADYELAFDGIRRVNDATVWLQNQPRAISSKTMDFHPGAAFIVDIGEGWCATVLDDLVKSLRVIRFPDATDDERRILLLLAYETSFGSASEPLANILAMAMQQTVRPAA